MRTTIEHIVKTPFYIGDKQVYSYIFYQDLSQYSFYNKNGWVIATISADRRFENEEELIQVFSEDKPTKRKEFMW